MTGEINKVQRDQPIVSEIDEDDTKVAIENGKQLAIHKKASMSAVNAAEIQVRLAEKHADLIRAARVITPQMLEPVIRKSEMSASEQLSMILENLSSTERQVTLGTIAVVVAILAFSPAFGLLVVAVCVCSTVIYFIQSWQKKVELNADVKIDESRHALALSSEGNALKTADSLHSRGQLMHQNTLNTIEAVTQIKANIVQKGIESEERKHKLAVDADVIKKQTEEEGLIIRNKMDNETKKEVAEMTEQTKQRVAELERQTEEAKISAELQINELKQQSELQIKQKEAAAREAIAKIEHDTRLSIEEKRAQVDHAKINAERDIVNYKEQCATERKRIQGEVQQKNAERDAQIAIARARAEVEKKDNCVVM